MAILKHQFYHHEKGNHDETWFHLARDTVTGRVFIVHEWAARTDVGNREMSLQEFLRDTTSAQDKLLQLIGTLVTEPANAYPS
jgi:hypothetical protein